MVEVSRANGRSLSSMVLVATCGREAASIAVIIRQIRSMVLEFSYGLTEENRSEGLPEQMVLS